MFSEEDINPIPEQCACPRCGNEFRKTHFVICGNCLNDYIQRDTENGNTTAEQRAI